MSHPQYGTGQSGVPQPNYGGYQLGNAPYGDAAPAVPPAPKKKNNTLRVIGAMAAIIGVICCGGAIGSVFLNTGDSADKQGAAVVTSSAAPAGKPTTAAPAAPAAEETEENTPGGETFNLRLGTTITTTTDEGTLEVTLSKSKIKSPRTTACKEYMSKPDAYYIVVDVRVKITKGTGSINPLYFTYVAPDGTTAEAISGMFAGCGKALDSGNDLRAGTLRSGQLVFDASAKTGSIEFGGSFFGGTQASWKV